MLVVYGCVERLWCCSCVFVLGLTGNAPSPDNCEHLVDERRYPVHGAATNLMSRACACFMQVLMVFAAFSLSAPFCSSATGVVWIFFVVFVTASRSVPHHLDQRLRNARSSRSSIRSLWSEVSRSPLLCLRRLVSTPK